MTQMETQLGSPVKGSMGCVHAMQMACHFVAAQCQGLLLFYIGLRSYLALNGNWSATHLFMANSTQWKESDNLGDTLDCVLSHSYRMIMSFDPAFHPSCIGPIGPASMYGLPVPYNIFLSAINLAGFTLVFLFVVVLFVELRNSGATNIGQGCYLAFTYKVQETKAFKLLSRILVFFVIALLCDTVRFMFALYLRSYGSYLINFAEYLLPTLLTLAYSAYSLGSAKVDLFFDYECEEFQALQFSRGWSDIVTDNNSFGQTLGMAILAQKRGSKKQLQEILSEDFEPKVSTVATVVFACDQRSEKEPLA